MYQNLSTERVAMTRDQLLSVCWFFASLLLLSAAGAPLPAQQTTEPPREQVGEVLGKPVYRDEVKAKGASRLFFAPLVAEYRREHQAEIEPTKDEIKAVGDFFQQKHAEEMKEKGPKMRARLAEVEQQLAGDDLDDKQRKKLEIEKTGLKARLRPPSEFFPVFILNNWKFQRHLYDHYGGGRILWQQAGLEAFDAMHKWLQDQERQGKFKVSDAKLRAELYHYWTTHNHGAFLTADKERIRSEFLEPAWLPKKDE